MHEETTGEDRDRISSEPATPEFIYFDLGNVLLTFDHHRAARQMAEVAGVKVESVWEIVFANDLELRYERGDFSTAEFHQLFCEQTDSAPSLNDLAFAASNIFEANEPVVSLLGTLRRAGHPLGLLSNTNDAHWSFVTKAFPALSQSFDAIALSFKLRSLKPDPEIYNKAARLAKIDPTKILFIDDRPENVAGAIEAKFDAVLFRGYQHLLTDLADRGLGPFD